MISDKIAPRSGQCLKCNKYFKNTELDINLECSTCQAKFYNKMQTLATRRNTWHKDNKYINSLNNELVKDILQEIISNYKLTISCKAELVKHLNKKFKLKLSQRLFLQLITPSNLKKHNLEWEYKKKYY